MSLPLFRPREASLPLIFAACAGIGLLVLGARADAAELLGNVAFTTGGVLRGVTQTQVDPAAQVGVALADRGARGQRGVVSASRRRLRTGANNCVELRVATPAPDSAA